MKHKEKMKRVIKYFVHVRHLCATNYRGSRFKVWDSFGNTKTYPNEYKTSDREYYALKFVEDFKHAFEWQKLDTFKCQNLGFCDSDGLGSRDSICVFFE